MLKFKRTLSAIAIAAACTTGMYAATPLAKTSAGGPATLPPGAIAAKATTAGTQTFATPRLLRPETRLQREARTAPPMKAPQRAYDTGADITGLFGWVNYSADWYEFHYNSGLYNIPVNSSQSYSTRFLNDFTVTGGTVKDGIYYCCYTMSTSFSGTTYTFVYYEGYDLATVDPQAPDRCRYYYSVPSIARSMTLDDSTGAIYAIANDKNSTAHFLAKFDFGEAENDYTMDRIGNLSGNWRTLACDRSGQLYGIRYYSEPGPGYDIVTRSELYKIDKNTAAATLVGDTGVKPQFDTDAIIDPRSGRMFWIVAPETESSYIAEVDLTTGRATPLYTLPDDALVKGLGIEAPAAYDKSPAAVTGASADFTGGSLSGTVSFTAPSTYFDGTPASGGAITARVTANGNPVASKNVTFGQRVTMDVTLPAAGLYNFDITVENAEGVSPKTTIADVFVGNGTPAAPLPVLTYDGGTMTLTWQPVSESADGGYINPADVTYSVVRFPDNVTVASGLKATSFSETIAEPASATRYHYAVTANFSGAASAPAESNSVLLGYVTPPYTADFNGSTDLFTVLNLNNDFFTWQQQEAWLSGLIGHENYMRINTYLDADADDWLLIPPVMLEAGKAYKLKFFVVTSNQNDETLEVRMGESADVAALTTVVLEPTVMRYGQGGEIERSIIINKTGRYTIGFHAMSPAMSFYLAIDDVTISAPYSSEVPAAISDLRAEAAPMGALSATVSLTAPSLTINGNATGALRSVDVYRNGSPAPVKTFQAPAAGQPLSFVDNVDAEGTYTYTATATNAEGTSDSAETSVFIGTGIPQAPANVRFTRTPTHGEVTLTWDAVTANTRNQSIDPAKVKYNLYTTDGYHSTELVKAVAGTTYTYQAVPAGQQAFMQFVVVPYTEAGTGAASVSNLDAVGTPYESMHESGQLDYAFTTAGDGGMWSRTDSDGLDIPSQDGDNMVYALAGSEPGDGGTLATGLISLAAMTSPGITFHIYSMGEDDTNTMKVSVTDAATGARTTVSDIANNTLPETHRWNKVMIPLDAFAGKTISVNFEGRLNQFTWLLIDNISVDNLLDHDLAVEEFATPNHAAAGTAFKVTATIRNEGMKTASGYKVEIVADGGDVLASTDGNPLESNKKADYAFDITMDALATEPLSMFARVVYAADQNTLNNTGRSASVAPAGSHLPAPRDLSASWHDNSTVLTWTEPDYAAGVAELHTEDFETAESWAHEFGAWQFVDVDGCPVGGLVGFTTPGIDYSITTSSFYVFDTTYEMSDNSFQTHSGTKMLTSLFRWDNGVVDDWAVSPRLDGMAQTISFYARSYHPSYPETIEVYYTTAEGAAFDPADYTLCATFADIAAVYTEFIANIPDGATHFAIRSCAKGAYMLQVDDVTFYPDAGRTPVELLGYDIYRDGMKLNSEPVTATSYTDSGTSPDAPYRYNAVAIYDKGFSRLSNAASLTGSGISEANASGITVTGGTGMVTVRGADTLAVSICAADGRTFFHGEAPHTLTVAVPRGIYIVKAGNLTAKIAVR